METHRSVNICNMQHVSLCFVCLALFTLSSLYCSLYCSLTLIIAVSQSCDSDGMEFTLRIPEGFWGRIYTHNHYGR